jgi:hypothetical protein
MISGHSNLWTDWHRYARLWGDALKWIIYFGAGWGAVYFRRWRKSRDEDIAQGWPSVEGLIISGKVAQIGHTSRFMVTLEYSFFLQEYHYGKYIHEFPKKSDADEFARTMQNKRVQIRYKQSNPDKSVLEQSVIEQHILLTPRFG